MNMSPSEIYRSWKLAKNRNGQIRVLSELNACEESVIKEIVEEEKKKDTGGIRMEVKERKKPGPKPKNPVATSQQAVMEEKQKERVDKKIACEVVPEEVRKAVSMRMQQLSDEADRIAKEVMTLSAWMAGTRR